MKIRRIRTKVEYRAALKEVSPLVDLDPKRGTPEGVRLDALVTAIEAYEAKHYPHDPDLTPWFDATAHSPSRPGWYDCKECGLRHYFQDGKWYRNAASLKVAGSMSIYTMHWRGLAQGSVLEAPRLNPKGIRVAIEDMCVLTSDCYQDQTDSMSARRKRKQKPTQI
jgi:hypothetical protein